MPASVSVTIHAPLTKVWEHLTKPDLIKQYFFGTAVETDWKPGSPICFRGSFEGKTYEDKGKILEFQPPKHLSFLYWSSFSGLPDLPENYQTVSYDLRAEQGNTSVAVNQDCLESKKEHCEQNWSMVLAGLKKQVEG